MQDTLLDLKEFERHPVLNLVYSYQLVPRTPVTYVRTLPEVLDN
jgi:hypothetical protein